MSMLNKIKSMSVSWHSSLAIGGLVLVCSGCKMFNKKQPVPFLSSRGGVVPSAYTAPVERTQYTEPVVETPDTYTYPTSPTTPPVTSTVVLPPRVKTPTDNSNGVSYTIKRGDSLWRIAHRNGMSVRDLAAYNNIPADTKLFIGKKIMIPPNSYVGSNNMHSPTTKATKTHTPKNNANNLVSNGIYVVQSGDFPGRIASKLNVRLSDLMKLNGLTIETAKKLQIGDKLKVPSQKRTGRKNHTPSVSTSTISSTNLTTSSSNNSTIISENIYVVKQNDNPDKIAKKLKVKLSDLMKVNNLTHGSAKKLQIGDTLKIPGKNTTSTTTTDRTNHPNVKSTNEVVPDVINTNEKPTEEFILADNRTFKKLAIIYSVSEKDLRNANKGLTDKDLKKGVKIKVPIN